MLGYVELNFLFDMVCDPTHFWRLIHKVKALVDRLGWRAAPAGKKFGPILAYYGPAVWVFICRFILGFYVLIYCNCHLCIFSLTQWKCSNFVDVSKLLNHINFLCCVIAFVCYFSFYFCLSQIWKYSFLPNKQSSSNLNSILNIQQFKGKS